MAEAGNGRSKIIGIELQPCLGNRSGVGTYALELAKRMSDKEDLVFRGNVFNYLGRHNNQADLAEISYRIQENRTVPYKAFRACQYLIPIPYKALFGKSDLNLFFNYIIPSGTSGKTITTIYDMTYIRFPETMKRRNYFRLKTGMEQAIRKADRIITISEFSKKEICSLLKVQNEKVHVIYCAAPDKGESANMADVSEKYGIHNPYILFVGTIEPRKNLVRLIQAFDLLKTEFGISHQLVLAGGNGWQNQEIYTAAMHAKHKEDIIFTGFVSKEVKASLYENASVFVFPSLYEGFGIPPLEAMQWGCPVVCANAASLPEAAGGAAEYVDPKDVQSIAMGVWKVLSDRHYADNLAEKGFEQVKKFSWDHSAEQLFSLCKEILTETSPNA